MLSIVTTRDHIWSCKQVLLSAIPFLLYILFCITLRICQYLNFIWLAELPDLVSQSVWLGHISHSSVRRPSQENIFHRAGQCLSSFRVCGSMLSVYCFFCGTDLNAADQTLLHQSWQLSHMYFLSLACYFICIFQSLFCGIVSILSSLTKSQFILWYLFHLIFLCAETGIVPLGMQDTKKTNPNMFAVSKRLKQLLRGWRPQYS